VYGDANNAPLTEMEAGLSKLILAMHLSMKTMRMWLKWKLDSCKKSFLRNCQWKEYVCSWNRCWIII